MTTPSYTTTLPPEGKGVAAGRAGLWIVVHTLPIVLLPVLTLILGPRFGLDGAAATMHSATLVFLPLAQAYILRHLTGFAAWWVSRALAGLGVALAVAMVVMSTIDLAGYDAAATPIAMGVAGLLQGLILGWPLRRLGLRRQWMVASVTGWLVGTIFYRLLIGFGLVWEIGGLSAFGYAYTGGHNELLWMSSGLAGFGIVTGFVGIARLMSAWPSRAR